jgi:hypothetical protein
MAEQFQNSALFPPHSEDLCVLDFVMLRTYVPDRNSKGLENCLVDQVFPAISVTLEPSVVYRLPKLLNRSASARQASIFGKRITLDHGMQI